MFIIYKDSRFFSPDYYTNKMMFDDNKTMNTL